VYEKIKKTGKEVYNGEDDGKEVFYKKRPTPAAAA
jgi:hypothetical protein